MKKITDFNGQTVKFIETTHVKDGVDCDVYLFINDNSKDLGIVTVKKGHKTPLQRVLKGKRTIEGHISGGAKLQIHHKDGIAVAHTFDGNWGGEVVVELGQTMQWIAAPDSDVVFYEICEPPYADGRFKEIA